MPEEKSLDVVKLEELDPSKFYQVIVRPPYHEDTITSFAMQAKAMGLKCLVTDEKVKFREIKKIFARLPFKKRQEIKALLDEPDAPKLILPHQ